jgi:DNA-binding FadR family transcriptional regulator
MLDTNLFEDTAIVIPLLAEQIAEKICRLIHERRLSQGEKLPSEPELAQLFHVGRGTIREAVKLLISRNILEIHRGKGTFVCEKPGIVEDPFGFTYAENKIQLVEDLITMRYILEPEIAFIAASNAGKDEIERMKAIVLNIDALARDNADYSAEDISFHTLIAESSRNMVMPQFIPVISYGIDLYNHSLEKYETLRALALHHDIISAIEARNPEQAKTSMRKHLDYNKKNIAEYMAAHGRSNPSNALPNSLPKPKPGAMLKTPDEKRTPPDTKRKPDRSPKRTYHEKKGEPPMTPERKPVMS